MNKFNSTAVALSIPYVIDNQHIRLADVLNRLLDQYREKSLDIATAYFNIRGFEILKMGLERVGSLRLLLGMEPTAGEHIGLRPNSEIILDCLRNDLNQEPFDEETLRLVEDLIRFLQQE